LDNVGDEMIIENQIKRNRITKLVGADLPLETEKMWQVLRLAMLEASDAGFEIRIYKKH
jgi:hypothetical protein